MLYIFSEVNLVLKKLVCILIALVFCLALFASVAIAGPAAGPAQSGYGDGDDGYPPAVPDASTLVLAVSGALVALPSLKWARKRHA